MTSLTTGVRPVDDLIGGARVGDNIVWQAGPGVDLGPFVAAFAHAARTSPCVVYVSLHRPPQAVLDGLGASWGEGGRRHLLDLYTDGFEGGAGTFYGSRSSRQACVHRVSRAADPGALYEAIEAIEGGWSRGTRYVFDSLTGMQQLWGREGALDFFLRVCPRLYDLRTVAYWLLERPAHSSAFLDHLARVTQVVVDVTEGEEGLNLRVAKATGRAGDVVGRRATVRFEGDRATVNRVDSGARERIGMGLRRQREARGVSLSQLARAVGISPSALSQAERGVTGLSAETLMAVLEALGGSLAAPDGAAYRISRRGTREVRTPARGITAEFLSGGNDSPSGTEVALVWLAPHSRGDGAPFETKQRELLVVLSGAVELRLGATWEALQAGDALDLVSRPVGGWRNDSPEEATVLWAFLAPAAEFAAPA